MVSEAHAGHGEADPSPDGFRARANREAPRAIARLGGEVRHRKSSEAARVADDRGEGSARLGRSEGAAAVCDKGRRAGLERGVDQGVDGLSHEERRSPGRDRPVLPRPVPRLARVGKGPAGRAVSRGAGKGLGVTPTQRSGPVRKVNIRPLRWIAFAGPWSSALLYAPKREEVSIAAALARSTAGTKPLWTVGAWVSV